MIIIMIWVMSLGKSWYQNIFIWVLKTCFRYSLSTSFRTDWQIWVWCPPWKVSHSELQSSNKIWVWPSSRRHHTVSWSWCTLPYCCAIMHNNLHEEWMLHHIIWRGSSTFQRNSVYHYCPCVLLPHFHLANLHHWVDSLQAQHCTCKNSGIHMVIKKDYTWYVCPW